MIIDASNLIAGRIATVVAKKALLGETIDIVNSEKAIVTGSKTQVFARFKQKYNMGIPSKGPFIHRAPERLLRRVVRGMLPYKQARGTDAFKRVMCWRGVPEEFQGKKLETIEGANISKISSLKYVTLGDIAKYLGGKHE